MKKIIALGIVVLTILALQIPGEKIYTFNNFIEYKLANVTVAQVQLKDHNISYYHGGSGDPVILLHGFGGSKENWNKMSVELTKQHKVYALDLPGFGDTAAIKKQYSIEDYRDIVISFIKALDLKKVKLVGHSTGGLVAASTAVNSQELIFKLWLISPLGAEGDFESEMTKKLKEGKNILIPKDIEEFENLLAHLFFKIPFIPSKVIEYVGNRSILSNSFLEKTFTATHGFSNGTINISPTLNQLLSLFDSEIFLTWGKEDTILSYRGGVQLKKEIPRIHLDIQEDVGHMSLIEKVELPPTF